MKHWAPSALALLILGVVVLGTGAGATFHRVANAAPHAAPPFAETRSLRGGHDPSGISTDSPSAAKASYRPQRRAAILPPGFFRAPAWLPRAQKHRPTNEAKASEGCPAAPTKV